MNTGIRPAVKQDIAVLCTLWQHCFSDSEDYVRLFYQENFDRMEVLVFTVNDKPVSMVHLMDAAFVDGNHRQNAKFIYAIGTHPAYRRNGYMSALLESIAEKARENRYALFLKPSTPSLTAYYQLFGYEPDASFRLVTLIPGERQPLSFTDISFEEYNRLRDAAFAAVPYVQWQDAHLRWCVMENEYFAGRTLGISLNGQQYFLMGYPEKDTLIINETNLSYRQLQHLSGALCALFDAERIKAYLPEDACEEGELLLSSVTYNTPHRNSYVNLILI